MVDRGWHRWRRSAQQLDESVPHSSDEVWRILAQGHDWIKFADTKAAADLTASGVLGGLALKSLPPWDRMGDAPLHYWLMLLSCIFAGASALIALFVLTPRVKNNHGSSLIFFRDIALTHRTADSYRQKVEEVAAANGGSLVNDAYEQIWSVAMVAKMKFQRVGWAMYCLGAALILAAVSSFVGSLSL
ncbi:Pycsar system effector family protein [Nocardia beijingensis]|uniref:Pycsar system effector family protein n=1 Tax=Nocardia beijingensis TaxID=95162 RepID=UPI00344D4E63